VWGINNRLAGQPKKGVKKPKAKMPIVLLSRINLKKIMQKSKKIVINF